MPIQETHAPYMEKDKNCAAELDSLRKELAKYKKNNDDLIYRITQIECSVVEAVNKNAELLELLVQCQFPKKEYEIHTLVLKEFGSKK